MLRSERMLDTAAIASPRAADLYGLDVLAHRRHALPAPLQAAALPPVDAALPPVDAAGPHHTSPHTTPRHRGPPAAKAKGEGSNTQPSPREAAKAIGESEAAGRMARGLRGVRDDLSELGRHLLDIACFLHPLLNPAHTDSPPPTPTGPPRRRAARRSPSPHPPSSPSLLAGILSDLAEIGGSFRGGFSRAAPSSPPPPTPAALESHQAAAASPPSPAASASASTASAA